jgi:hypothetical protein
MPVSFGAPGHCMARDDRADHFAAEAEPSP